jgi:6,7-dimethyl-8-ribityllumazine synthase
MATWPSPTCPARWKSRSFCKPWRRAASYDALVALGAVIRGDTYHFEVVSNDSCRAVMEVQLHTGIPIANGILTCESDEQAEVRMQQKGSDCAQAAVEMANLQKALGQ